MKVSELDIFSAITLETFKGIGPLRIATWFSFLKLVIGTEVLELSHGGLCVSGVESLILLSLPDSEFVAMLVSTVLVTT
jgi:hypothetical protein